MNTLLSLFALPLKVKYFCIFDCLMIGRVLGLFIFAKPMGHLTVPYFSILLLNVCLLMLFWKVLVTAINIINLILIALLASLNFKLTIVLKFPAFARVYISENLDP